MGYGGVVEEQIAASEALAGVGSAWRLLVLNKSKVPFNCLAVAELRDLIKQMHVIKKYVGHTLSILIRWTRLPAKPSLPPSRPQSNLGACLNPP